MDPKPVHYQNPLIIWGFPKITVPGVQPSRVRIPGPGVKFSKLKF